MSAMFLRGGTAVAVTFAASALAQSNVQPEVSAPPASAAESATTSAPAPAPPAAPAATPAAAGDAAARPATPREVGTIVQSEFPTRDANHDGGLDRAEFTSWLRELVSRSPGASDGDAAGLDARIATAFTQSDADGSGAISEAEMTALLSRRQ